MNIHTHPLQEQVKQIQIKVLISETKQKSAQTSCQSPGVVVEVMTVAAVIFWFPVMISMMPEILFAEGLATFEHYTH